MGLFDTTATTTQNVRRERPQELIGGQMDWFRRQLQGMKYGAGDFGLGSALRQAEGTLGSTAAQSGISATSPLMSKLRSGMYQGAVNSALTNKYNRGMGLATGNIGSQWSPGYTSTGSQTSSLLPQMLASGVGAVGSMGLDFAGIRGLQKMGII